MTTFDDASFFSDDARSLQATYRNLYQASYAAADKCISFGARVCVDAKLAATREGQVLGGLFVRLFTGFQAVVLLLERGMQIEASSMLRHTVETALFMGGISASPTLIDDLRVVDERARRYIAKQILAFGTQALSEAHVAALEDIAHTKASEFPSGKKPKIENIAKTGSMEALYEITYRSLSNGAAHAGLSAIAKYFEDENGAQADAPFCGPSHVGTPEILNLAILALTQGIARATPHMDIGDDLRKELEQLIELSRTL